MSDKFFSGFWLMPAAVGAGTRGGKLSVSGIVGTMMLCPALIQTGLNEMVVTLFASYGCTLQKVFLDTENQLETAEEMTN